MRRAANQPPGRPGFLEDLNGDGSATLHIEDPDSPALLKRRIQELQIMNVDLQKMVTKLEGMLKLESSINQELKLEMESIATTTGADSHRHLVRAQDSETLR